jgi:hypothetical protein
MLNIAGRFVNPAVIGKRVGIGFVTNTTGAAFTAGTAPTPNSLAIVIGVAEANNQYMSHSLIVEVPMTTGLYVYPVAWQSVGAAQTVDSVMFSAAKLGDL